MSEQQAGDQDAGPASVPDAQDEGDAQEEQAGDQDAGPASQPPAADQD